MISTHILDTTKGLPAENVEVLLEKKEGENWSKVALDKTNKNGRIDFAVKSEKGIYKLTFKIENYYKAQDCESFFADTPVVFNIKDISRKYHIPLLLNPFAHTTYLGS